MKKPTIGIINFNSQVNNQRIKCNNWQVNYILINRFVSTKKSEHIYVELWLIITFWFSNHNKCSCKFNRLDFQSLLIFEILFSIFLIVSKLLLIKYLLNFGQFGIISIFLLHFSKLINGYSHLC